MTSVILGIILLYIAVIFLVWQLGLLSKDYKASVQVMNEQDSRIIAQEEHLKRTLEIMQDLAKKMHMQQEVLDRTTAKLGQIELQNVELIQILQNKSSNLR
ncbi:hypothetical protein [Acinetobacter sp. ANC 4648]|uniref:hypothetical protein n=1 Tax=Acinetobacter sp. ANC 4648 TaxID=1977875 RepID=UPI000A350028|nr:hypothetical protein [Acinetobacter sp. ANC 4648]OTG83129.1 hypothetical protein B9T27_07640 [Acinetobacter sp. ANC 4648]